MVAFQVALSTDWMFDLFCNWDYRDDALYDFIRPSRADYRLYEPWNFPVPGIPASVLDFAADIGEPHVVLQPTRHRIRCFGSRRADSVLCNVERKRQPVSVWNLGNAI